MLESREIVHRPVLRAKGLDPDLVPSPSGGDARGPFFLRGDAKKENAGAGESPGAARRRRRRGRISRASSFSRASTPRKRPRARRLGGGDEEIERWRTRRNAPPTFSWKTSSSRRSSPSARRRGRRRRLHARRRGDNFLRVRHEVTNARLERRVRLALVDPEAAPEVDAVDVASEIPGVRIVRGARRDAASAPTRKEKPGPTGGLRSNPGFASGLEDSVAVHAGGLNKGAVRPNANVSASASRGGRTRAPPRQPRRRAPRRLAAGNARREEQGDRSFEKHQTHSGDHSSDSLAHIMSPRDARVSASLRALVAEAPTRRRRRGRRRGGGARKKMRRAARRRRGFGSGGRAKRRVRSEHQARRRPRAFERRTARARRTHRRGAGLEGRVRRDACGPRSARQNLRGCEGERRDREHACVAPSRVVSRLRRGVDASRDTIVNECEPDVAAPRRGRRVV